MRDQLDISAGNGRIRSLSKGDEGNGPVMYWMSRDQRVRNNWAMYHAQSLALRRHRPLIVVFCLLEEFMGAQDRHFNFMIRGLEEVNEELGRRGIGFRLLRGDPTTIIPNCISDYDVCTIFTDFSPIRIKTSWTRSIAGQIDIPFYEVDAHNIIPCWVTSNKMEYAAYTIRPKINRSLDEYLVEMPPIRKHPCPWRENEEWDRESYQEDGGLGWISPGESAALRASRNFISNGLGKYPDYRNDPSARGQSGLSPYLHFGQLSAQRLALEVDASDAPKHSREAFLEELVVRRELSDNFCFYNESYDTTGGFPNWARVTLDEHRGDEREYTYSTREFEEGRTHDSLWNAAQLEMVVRGKMHGYMRMYWAKKLLEWSETPEAAMETGIYLNDKYELDGRDPNGYAGMAWSIGGVHDRAWGERPVFGKIRYMNRRGCERKFDVQAYIDGVETLSRGE